VRRVRAEVVVVRLWSAGHRLGEVAARPLRWVEGCPAQTVAEVGVPAVVAARLPAVVGVRAAA
jgi:hypothetical protein